MHIIRFLVWFVCFWPLIALTNYLHQKILEFPEVLIPTSHVWIAAYSGMWLIVILHELWFTRHRPATDARARTRVRCIVEAPSTEQFEATRELYVEQVLALQKPFVPGSRIVCEATDNGAILGTVVDVAELEKHDDDPPICAWVKLDRADDYKKLCECLTWRSTPINWRRSPLPLAPKAEIAHVA